MKSLFNKTDFDLIIIRLNKLTPGSQRQWGKMHIETMLFHCQRGLEIAMGERQSIQTFLGKVLSPFFKSLVTTDKPFRHGSPSPAGTITADTEGFEKEKSKLIDTVKKFHNEGIENCKGDVHAFFGKLTPAEWGFLMHKHLDHHLRQFGA